MTISIVKGGSTLVTLRGELFSCGGIYSLYPKKEQVALVYYFMGNGRSIWNFLEAGRMFLRMEGGGFA